MFYPFLQLSNSSYSVILNRIYPIFSIVIPSNYDNYFKIQENVLADIWLSRFLFGCPILFSIFENIS